jgi:hypothetical protein
MKKTINFGTLLLCACFCFSAHAFDPAKQPCANSITQMVGKHIAVSNFKLSKAENGGVIVDQACKTYPTDAAKSIAVFGYDGGGNHEKKFVVALIDTSKRKIVSIYQDIIQEDAVLTLGKGSFHIDTARYNLAQGIRAFGVDIASINHGGRGCYEGGFGPERRLFAQFDDKMKSVMQGFQLSNWTYTKGGMTCNVDSDQSKEEFSYSITVGNGSTNGLANLQILRTSSQRKRRPFSYVLRYDGEKYSTEGLQNAIYKWR